MPRATERKGAAKGGRPSLGHTEMIPLKLHPQLKAHVSKRAAARFCSEAEFIRQLIIDDIALHGEEVAS